MLKKIAIFLLTAVSISAVEIPLDDQWTVFSLKHHIQLWIKELIPAPAQVACRLIGHDPRQAKPHIFDLDCPSEIFEEELPSFLDYCEEEIEKSGGTILGVVAVGHLNAEGLYRFLENRYEQRERKAEEKGKVVQLFSVQNGSDIEILLTYPTPLPVIISDMDLKKLWTVCLIQTMAQHRFKKAAIATEGKWIAATDSKNALPTTLTVAHAYDRAFEDMGGRVLEGFLRAVQQLKERGFTENELADAKTQLLKHLNRLYETRPTMNSLADYNGFLMAAGLPRLDYSAFMTLSFHMIPEIEMTDIADVLKDSFKDDMRQVVLHHPSHVPAASELVHLMLNQYKSDLIEFKDKDEELVIIEGVDPFSQLTITDDEQALMRKVIKTVAESNVGKLFIIQSDLEEHRKQLLHIHPLRALATMFSDPYTSKGVAKIMNSVFKRGHFVSDFSDRLKREGARDNLLQHVQGFSATVKANPEQVRQLIETKEWEKLIKYLVKVTHSSHTGGG